MMWEGLEEFGRVVPDTHTIVGQVSICTDMSLRWIEVVKQAHTVKCLVCATLLVGELPVEHLHGGVMFESKASCKLSST